MQPNATPPDLPHYIPGDQQFYTVSNKDIYNLIMLVQGQITTLVTQGSQSARDIDDHEVRLRGLEKARWPLPSLAILISLASIVYAVFIRTGWG